MTPHDAPELLSAYLDGELDDAAVGGVEAHLASCATCRETLAALRATVADLALLLDDPAPSEQDSWALRARLARERKQPGRIVRGIVAASGAAAVVIGFVAFAGGPDTAGPALDTLSAPYAMEHGGDALFSESDADFTAESARALLQGESGVPASAPAENDAAGLSKESQSMRAVIDWNDALVRCDRVVLAGAVGTTSLERSIGASFDGTPALLMIYRVDTDQGSRRELWVMDAATCTTLFFAQDGA